MQPEIYMDLSVCQMSAGPTIAERVGDNLPDYLRFLADKDTAGSQSCLISAFATGVNVLYQARVIGEGEESIHSVGDLIAAALQSDESIYTETGDMYHEVVLSVAEALGLEAKSLHTFTNVGDFGGFVQHGGVVVISLDNRIIAEKTLPAVAETMNLTEEDVHEIGASLRPGRHAFTLVWFDKNTFLCIDPFLATCVPLRTDELNTYLPKEGSRAIALVTQDNGHLLDGVARYENHNVSANPIIVDSIRDYMQLL